MPDHQFLLKVKNLGLSHAKLADERLKSFARQCGKTFVLAIFNHLDQFGDPSRSPWPAAIR